MTTLLLDVDGVLVGGRPGDGRHPFSDLERDFGFTHAQLETAFFHTGYWMAAVTGRAALPECLTEALRAADLDADVPQLIDYWLRNDARVDPLVLEGVRALRRRGIATILATNQEHLRASYLLREMRLAEDVTGIVYSAQLGCLKPDPEFFRLALDRTQLSVSDIVFVDDNPANVEAARRAGWPTAHWVAGSRLEPLVDALLG